MPSVLSSPQPSFLALNTCLMVSALSLSTLIEAILHAPPFAPACLFVVSSQLACRQISQRPHSVHLCHAPLHAHTVRRHKRRGPVESTVRTHHEPTFTLTSFTTHFTCMATSFQGANRMALYRRQIISPGSARLYKPNVGALQIELKELYDNEFPKVVTRFYYQ